MTRRRAAIAVALLLTWGCATGKTWVPEHPDPDGRQTAQDEVECRALAGNAATNLIDYGAFFKRCMFSRGYDWR